METAQQVNRLDERIERQPRERDGDGEKRGVEHPPDAGAAEGGLDAEEHFQQLRRGEDGDEGVEPEDDGHQREQREEQVVLFRPEPRLGAGTPHHRAHAGFRAITERGDIFVEGHHPGERNRGDERGGQDQQPRGLHDALHDHQPEHAG